MMRDVRDVRGQETPEYGLKPISDMDIATTDADVLHYTRGIVCHILHTPESFRAFAAVALRLLLEEGMEG